MYKGIQPDQFDKMHYYEFQYLLDEWKEYLDKQDKQREADEKRASSDRQRQESAQRSAQRKMRHK